MTGGCSSSEGTRILISPIFTRSWGEIVHRLVDMHQLQSKWSSCSSHFSVNRSSHESVFTHLKFQLKRADTLLPARMSWKLPPVQQSYGQASRPVSQKLQASVLHELWQTPCPFFLWKSKLLLFPWVPLIPVLKHIQSPLARPDYMERDHSLVSNVGDCLIIASPMQPCIFPLRPLGMPVTLWGQRESVKLWKLTVGGKVVAILANVGTREIITRWRNTLKVCKVSLVYACCRSLG